MKEFFLLCIVSSWVRALGVSIMWSFVLGVLLAFVDGKREKWRREVKKSGLS